MSWTNDPERFVVPAGMTAGEAEIVRRQLQLMARMDALMDTLRANQQQIAINMRTLNEQRAILEQILLAATHYELEFQERAVGDNRSN